KDGSSSFCRCESARQKLFRNALNAACALYAACVRRKGNWKTETLYRRWSFYARSLICATWRWVIKFRHTEIALFVRAATATKRHKPQRGELPTMKLMWGNGPRLQRFCCLF